MVYGSDGRTWGAFGTAVMGLGIAILFNVVLVCTVNKQMSIIAIIVGMAGLIIAFLGIKIASLDKREKPRMLRIDPKLDYHFLLTFRGMQEEVKDFSRMEEVLLAFDEGREAWNLKIVPPMGTLSEWKGYYDDKEKTYVMEIFFIRKEGIQRWARRCDYDGLVKLNRSDLKKIIVNKRKANLYLFGRIEGDKKSTPDMAGYRPEQEWWPDLTTYQKAILLHNITCAEVDALLREYAEIYSDEKQIICDFYYTPLPDDTLWIYLVFPHFKSRHHHVNFWNYQNLLTWFSQKTDKEFCLAIPRNQNQPLFLSTINRDNPNGDSCIGVYADRSFNFAIPENIFEWGYVPTSAYDYEGFLKDRFQFDIKWIFEITQCELKKTQVTLGISE
ncbi:MAG: hypothetical protein J1E64_11425 [Acetatifactor sp.]|nr:hypothetical protein [Acetatifactor sp.]